MWNIGAEGQFVVGGIVPRCCPARAPGDAPRAHFVTVLLAGVTGEWRAALTAFLRDRFNANEIPVSLMLTYVGGLLLIYGQRSVEGIPRASTSPTAEDLRGGRDGAAPLPGTRPTGHRDRGLRAGGHVGLHVALDGGFSPGCVGPRAACGALCRLRRAEGIWLSASPAAARPGLAGALEVAGRAR